MKKILTLSCLAALSTSLVSGANFSGFYAGVNAGYTGPKFEIKEDGKKTVHTPTLGMQIGFSGIPTTNLYLGIEAGMNYDGFLDKRINDNGVSVKLSKIMHASLAPRIGYKFDRGILYTGGFVTYNRYQAVIARTDLALVVKGFGLGPLLGFEYSPCGNLSYGLEARYQFGPFSKKFGTSKVSFKELNILARVNYSF